MNNPIRPGIPVVTQDEKYWKDRALAAEKKNKIIIYLDECEISSVHSSNPNIEVVLMDADNNYIHEKELEEMFKEETKEMKQISINEIVIK